MADHTLTDSPAPPTPEIVLDIHALRPFAVCVNGEPIAFANTGAHKPLRLLKALVALGGDKVAAQQLTDALWPDSDGDRAQAVFTTTLHRLRKLVGADALILRDGRLSLDAKRCRVDTWDFAQALEHGQRAIECARLDEVSRWSAHAIALYQAPFLDGEFEQAEVLSLRERLHARFLRHVHDTGAFYRRIGETARALALYQRGLEIDDLAEELCRDLMRCLAEQGRQGEALQVYRRFQQILLAKVGLEPSAETDALYTEIRTAIPHGAAAEAEHPVPEGAPVVATETEPGPDPAGERGAAAEREAEVPARPSAEAAPASTDATVEAASNTVPRRAWWRRLDARHVAAAVAVITLVVLLWGLSPEPERPAEVVAIPQAEPTLLAVANKPSIAVLRFENISDDTSTLYLSDGLTEDLITTLAQFQNLLVISPQSVFTYGGQRVDIRKAARDLDVRYVLEGSLRVVGERVRITARLAEGENGHYLWADQYDVPLRDILSLQDTITDKIVTALDIELLEGEQTYLGRTATTNLDAYRLWRRAKDYWYDRTTHSKARAEDWLKRAIVLDPDFVMAYVSLGILYIDYPAQAGTDDVARAESLAERALSIDHTFPAIHVLLSKIHLAKKDLDNALESAREAVRLRPNGTDELTALAMVLFHMRRIEEASPVMRQALRLSPYPDPSLIIAPGLAHFIAGNYEDAVVHFEKATVLVPDHIYPHLYLATIYSEQGRWESAQTEVNEILRIRPDFSLHDVPRLFSTSGDAIRTAQVEAGLRKLGLD